MVKVASFVFERLPTASATVFWLLMASVQVFPRRYILGIWELDGNEDTLDPVSIWPSRARATARAFVQ